MSLMMRFLCAFVLGGWAAIAAPEGYLDVSLPPARRAELLLSQMTLEEKVAQMCQFVGIGHAEAAKKVPDASKRMDGIDAIAADNLGIKGIAKRIALGEVGSCLHVTTAEEANRIQEYARMSRLKIPVLIGVDAIHGNGLHRGATIYPTSIGLASTFNPDLVRETGVQTAREMRATGMHWTFNPNIEIARDPRWGRTGETFGEDTYLITRMGVALIKGLQGDNGVEQHRVLACAKHMLGGGEPMAGLNAAPTDMSNQKLREVYLPPFEAAVKEGNVFTIMPAHNEVNGIPCHANPVLMRDIVRKEFGFTGFYISDWMDVARLKEMHHYLPTHEEAYRAAVEAGVDMHMHGPGFMEAIVKAVQEERISEGRVDAAVRKILEAKFLLGLFENPFVDLDRMKECVFTPEHRKTALEAARQSMVLLKNDGLLPLDPRRFRRILVTGPNADNQAMMGDWVFEQPRENYVTVVEGIKKAFPKAAVETACTQDDIVAMKDASIEDAVAKAKEADVVVAVLGENALRYTGRKITCGENYDRDNIDLPGRQQELLERLYKTGKPVVLVLINGRPLGVHWADRHVNAIVEAWEPGSFGGQAIAEVIAGAVNPSGRLAMTIPRHVGQVPTIYNHKASQFSRRYALSPSGPLYAFGYGLSYTEWRYDEVKLSRPAIGAGESAKLSCRLTNAGGRAGTEVVQLYIRDEYASVTRPVKELKGFKRVFLQPGESTTVEFDVTPDMLKFYTARGKWEVEPGMFRVMVGSSSRDQDLKAVTLTVK